MAIYINNSLTRKKEEFLPLNPGQVNIYTCGVTVYDQSHIGHARSLYIFDLIRRYLLYRGFKVRFVRNITDIDDKIINRANDLKIDWKELVSKYIACYYEDLGSLGVKKGDFEPRATENIPEMIKYIQALIDKGYAYDVEGDVYFNVRKFSGYGKLSGQGIDEMEPGSRIETSALKKDPLDFALWKRSKDNEPYWESPWGKGRPGWHIECSVMSQKFLGVDTLDIHAGGRDLIFPHHENEIAQSEALTDKPFAKYWIHHGLLTINSQKMSKSLGNFITIKDFMEKYKDADLLKLFFLSAHYSHPIDYTQEKIEEAVKQRKSFKAFLDKVSTSVDEEGKAKPLLSEKDKAKLDEIYARFEAAMDDDFNTPQAVGCLFTLIDYASSREGTYIYALDKVKKCLGLLGLGVKPVASVPDIVKEKNEERIRLKRKKEYPAADKIRDEITRMGFSPVDTGNATSFIEVISE